jgi:hypothetical protein
MNEGNGRHAAAPPARVRVPFRPVALALGMARLGKPDSVRSARVMLCIALGQFSLALLAAIGIVTTVAVNPPRVVLELLP